MKHPLKQFREQQKPPLSQARLAGMLAVSKATVSRWEAGIRKIDVGLVPVVAKKTGIPAAQLRPDFAELFGAS